MKKLTKKQKKQLADLYQNVDSEGFGYYMLDYGPDLKTIELLGFSKDLLKSTLDTMSKIQEAINDCERYTEESYED